MSEEREKSIFENCPSSLEGWTEEQVEELKAFTDRVHYRAENALNDKYKRLMLRKEKAIKELNRVEDLIYEIENGVKRKPISKKVIKNELKIIKKEIDISK